MTNKFFAFILTSILFVSCAKKAELIQNPDRIADVQRMLTEQKSLTSKSLLPIWDIFKQPLTESEKQAMEFLYAYMPLSDLADYKPEFFLKNVQFALLARQEMPWGRTIPEEEFLHFALPLRVNNENLDNFREVMYPEIKERIKVHVRNAGFSKKTSEITSDFLLQVEIWKKRIVRVIHEHTHLFTFGMTGGCCTVSSALAFEQFIRLPGTHFFETDNFVTDSHRMQRTWFDIFKILI